MSGAFNLSSFSLSQSGLSYFFSMSGLKNSPFGKRLRASHREPSSSTAAATDDDVVGSRGSPKRQRFLGGGIGIGGMGIVREYGDRFVPSKDSGDLRTSYHLMEEGGGGPSTPSKSRIIPSESDALKGEYSLSFIYSENLTNL